ncbi:MAG: Hsp70 family protein [Candidatus Sericytochromatia bacterium]|nr:Hsp70 family protein [Candidatus Tanganyikabacteria bacterium]
MAGRLAVDFGTSNTVLAVWDAARKEADTLILPDLTRGQGQGAEILALVPSLIHYSADSQHWVGHQVHRNNLYSSDRTFRWMKRYISSRTQVPVMVDGRRITHHDAGRDFLAQVLGQAAAVLGVGDEEVAFTVPVEAFEYYEDWLARVAEEAGISRFRVVDEPSAAALGYGAHIQPGDVYLVFDFGGGTLDVAVVLVEAEDPAVATGRRCRMLGKAGRDLGGATVDQWLFEEVLRRVGRRPDDPEVRLLGRALLVECERAKERLSQHERADVTVVDPRTGRALSAEFTRHEFEELLDRHDMFADLDRTLRRALNDARERGYAEERIKAVLLVGGSSQIPAVQATLRRIFGRDRVMLDRPLDAVARGAAAFVSGVDFYDHIQHDYAIRYVDLETGGYRFEPVVRRGTPYPSHDALRTLRIKATYEGQSRLGLALFEMGERAGRGPTGGLEIVFDPGGAVRLAPVTPDQEENRSAFWINEHSPTFLEAEPPAREGETRFEVAFAVDAQKRLLVTVRDLRRDRLTHRDFPVVRLQ